MKTLINYFGMIAEKLEITSEELEFDTSEKAIDLRSFFESRYPELASLSYKIAVNQEFKEQLEIGINVNEIALLPPFAGG